MTERRRIVRPSFLLICALALVAPIASGQTPTSFTYQGRLSDGGTPATAQYDLQFALFNSLLGGPQTGGTLTLVNVTVTNGGFSVQLDFGAPPFTSTQARFLEIGVRPGGTFGAFTLLAPRQPVTSTPYAVQSLNAEQLGGVAASQYVMTGGNGFIQNTTVQQTGANFNIAGNGTIGGNLTVGGTFSLNIVNAVTQYNLGGQRILSNAGSQNTFLGVNSGGVNSGGDNTFVGHNTGPQNTTGNVNSFFGTNAGANNRTGNDNSFFGGGAGLSNFDGVNNTFFGAFAGFNANANNNSFFGTFAGLLTTTGFDNAFFGQGAGNANLTGAENSFFGKSAGLQNTTGGRIPSLE